MPSKNVLLTGVTGFLGSHTAIQLLNSGYHVTGTLRSKDRETEIRTIIAKHTKNSGNLSFAEADLNDSSIWTKLMKGVDFVLHVASPFPRTLPKHENELILPAKQGTLHVLEAAAASKVKRVVLVSSLAAVCYGKTKEERKKVFTEDDWTNEHNKKDTTPYYRSKVIAEKAAWDFMKTDHSGLELTTILPGAILGPVLENDFGTSANIVLKLLDGSSPAIPKIGFEIVDVRSVAALMIRAMEAPQAAGNRYAASAGYLTMNDVAKILRDEFPKRKIPRKELPNFAVRLLSNFDRSLKPVLLELGIKRNLEGTKAIRELQWNPVSTKEAVISCAKSIFELRIIQ